MRALIGAVLFTALLVTAASAVPVNPVDPQGVAAVLPIYSYDANGGILAQVYVLSTAGQVWQPCYPPCAQWNRGCFMTDCGCDLPVPVSEVADWWGIGFRTMAGVIWVLRPRPECRWVEAIPPPFAPVATQQKSLGTAKQGYR